jgi:hypothetical protein
MLSVISNAAKSAQIYPKLPKTAQNCRIYLETIELFVKSSKESIERINLLKTGNKVVEVG